MPGVTSPPAWASGRLAGLGHALTRGLLLALLLPVAARAALIRVPADQPTIQGALALAAPGDLVEVATGVFHEKLVFPASGLPGARISLVAAPGATPVLDGSGVAGQNMVLINGKSHLLLQGFEIRNHLGVADGSGIRIVGSGTDLVIRDNLIHDIRGDDAMGITVYGTGPTPISQLVISGNQIFDCEPAESEALTLNGNITGFQVTDNLVRDVDSIGIDMIGGETDIQPNPSLVARNGVVRGNTVLRANSSYEGGFGAGIYVDGGRDITIENNFVGESDLGIEVGAENAGIDTAGIVVRNNVLFHNERAGLVFGGFEQSVGRARDNVFRGNTLFQNNTVGESGQGRFFAGGGVGEIWVQFARDNQVENNLVFAGAENVFVASFDAGSSVRNSFDFNLYFSTAGVGKGAFDLNGASFTGLTAWRKGTGQDASSVAVDPLLAAPPADFRLTAGSPAIDAGDPGFVPAPGETDAYGEPRLVGSRVDIGADESGGVSVGPCVPDAMTLCLNGGRFRVETTWRTRQGASGRGQAVPLTADTGFFWFFLESNVEMVVKLLFGCPVNEHFWVFAGGLTDVQVEMTVTDSQTGAARSYRNPQGTAFRPIQDTSAFATCP